jgi:hypothetical protein
VQWILYRKHRRKSGDTWDGLSFVSSTKDILARCMREKGVPEDGRAILLVGLPPTFDEWKITHPPSQPSRMP